MQSLDLADAAGAWRRSMQAARKSAKTITVYQSGLAGFLAWCERTGREPALTADLVNAHIASLHDAGLAPATALLRYRGLRQFSAYLVRAEYLTADPLAKLSPPQLDEVMVPKLTDDELRAMLKACAGKRFQDKRDELIVRLAVDTLARAEELLAIELDDLDTSRMVATIRRGKGGKARLVPYQPATAVALDRYMRVRRGHRLAGARQLLLGARGGLLGYGGLYQALQRRADLAGVADFHPHRLRHTGASRWLGAGGSEGGLMAVAGWKNRNMLDRYVKDTAAERAVAEFRSLTMGEL